MIVAVRLAALVWRWLKIEREHGDQEQHAEQSGRAVEAVDPGHVETTSLVCRAAQRRGRAGRWRDVSQSRVRALAECSASSSSRRDDDRASAAGSARLARGRPLDRVGHGSSRVLDAPALAAGDDHEAPRMKVLVMFQAVARVSWLLRGRARSTTTEVSSRKTNTSTCGIMKLNGD